MSKAEVHNQNKQGIDNSSTCRCRISTCIEFKPGSPNVIPIQNKGKGPPCRSRSPGSSLGGLNWNCVPSARRQLIINNKEELFQINHN